jgi:hypothetical protein
VGSRTVASDDLVAQVLRGEGARGRLTVNRFDGSGEVELEYITFPTRAAGLPYMASFIWEAETGAGDQDAASGASAAISAPSRSLSANGLTK